MRYLLAFTLFIAPATTGTLFGQGKPCSASSVDLAKTSKEMRDINIVEALLAAGQSSHTCFGVDVRNPKWLSRRFNLPNRASLDEIIRILGAPISRQMNDSVVVLQVDGTDGSDWIDVTIPSFQTFEAPTEVVSSKVFAFLFAYAYPKAGGSIGSVSTRNGGTVTKAFTIDHGPVKKILSKVVANSAGGGIWFTTGPHERAKALPDSQFWTILSYSEPVSDNEGRISNATFSASPR